MAHHLARSAKRKEEHPVCGAAPLDTQFVLGKSGIDRMRYTAVESICVPMV